MSQDTLMKNVRGPLSPEDRKEFEEFAAEDSETTCWGLLIKHDDALRAALERAERAELECVELGKCISLTEEDRDAALAERDRWKELCERWERAQEQSRKDRTAERDAALAKLKTAEDANLKLLAACCKTPMEVAEMHTLLVKWGFIKPETTTLRSDADDEMDGLANYGDMIPPKTEPPFVKVCSCLKIDSWRCAVMQSLKTITCDCACHASPTRSGA